MLTTQISSESTNSKIYTILKSLFKENDKILPATIQIFKNVKKKGKRITTMSSPSILPISVKYCTSFKYKMHL